MERLKQMNLKKAFFCLTMLFLLAALIFSIFSILGISRIFQHYGPTIEIKFDGNNFVIPPAITTDHGLPLWYQVLGISQFALPVLFVIVSLILADLVFGQRERQRGHGDAEKHPEGIRQGTGYYHS